MNAQAKLFQPINQATPSVPATSAPVLTPEEINTLYLEEYPADPKNDGITHINIYIHGATDLGKSLTHFSHSPFIHPKYGTFQCMEGYWHWLRAVTRTDKLRYLTGGQAKEFSRDMKTEFVENFQELILEGNYCKITQNPQIRDALIASSLPFDQYYKHDDGTADGLPVRVRSYDWLAPQFAVIRGMLQNGVSPKGLL